MKLVRVRVSNYKSVLDSEWFSVGDLTCLVGKNESGKTAVLEALEKIYAVRDERGSLLDTDYPRLNWSEYEESDAVDTAIETEWQLTDSELEHIQKLGQGAVLSKTTVGVSKDYDNVTQWQVPLDFERAVRNIVEHAGLDGDESTEVASLQTTTEILKFLKELPDPSPRQQATLAELVALWDTASGLDDAVTRYLSSNLPRFLYYSQYDKLPGRISLDQLSHSQNSIEGAQVFLALLKMVGTSPVAISEIQTSEELIGKLEAVQARITKQIFAYWSQNKHLKVRFRFDEARPGDLPPFNTGKIFQTRIENTRHEATIRLDERSTGFIWFFSFLVWFSQVQREFGENLIILLDEPGLTLHARAQADLLRYMKTELVPRHQVIYTTHSPFMIDSGDLLSCRTVEDASGVDDEVLGTKVGDRVLSSDGDTVFPLQAALGYDLTQTLFVGEHCLLVEGSSDLLYLQWASNELRAGGRQGLDERWTVTPCGGITKVPSFMALFGGSRLHVAVLVDHGSGDKRRVREMRESDLLRDGHVLTADKYAASSASEADVEDVLGRRFYADLINATYGLKAGQKLPAQRPKDAAERVVGEVEQHFRTLPNTVREYDHFAPAAHLLANPGIASSGRASALDNFERLFGDINALL